MKNIISIIQPFIFKQNIYLFDNGNLKTEVGVMIGDVGDTIIKLAQTEQAYDVTLKGAPEFTGKVREDLELKELVTFGRRVLNITVE